MEQIIKKKLAGIDISPALLQLSIYDGDSREIKEIVLPLEAGRDDYVEYALSRLSEYMVQEDIPWEDFSNVQFSLEDTSREVRSRLMEALGKDFVIKYKVKIITRLHAFVEYVFHQEKVNWERNALLIDYTGDRMHCMLVEQIAGAKQKAYRAVTEILLPEKYIQVKTGGLPPDKEEKDAGICRLMKIFIGKHPAQVVYLTGNGFEGNWMKKTLNFLCSGRRVFLGQNLYANGACLMAERTLPLLEEGLVLIKGPDMVQHSIGVVTMSAGRTRNTPITAIGKEWYNTTGSLDIILDKTRKVDFFFHNARENMMEVRTCEVTDLPGRPEKTTRIRIQVNFSSQTEGTILLKDLGFGSMYPGTGKVTVFPFSLIS